MNSLLTILLRLAGVGLITLAIVHIPIAKRLKWREEAARLSPPNRAIFHVHTAFICVVLVMMALPCIFEPAVFLEKSRAARWLAWSFSGFWGLRLYAQWFIYPFELWRGKNAETIVHWIFTFVWLSLTALFAVCGVQQLAAN